MTRYLILLLSLVLFACTGRPADNSNKPLISVSILPQKYFIEQIAGDMVEVNVMIPPGASPATYEPTVLQLQKLKNSFAYMRIGHIGFELTWMDKIQSVNRDMPVYDLSEGVELIHGEEDHSESDHGEADHAGHHHHGVDPHIWLSPKNAAILGKNIYEALLRYLPEESDALKKNYTAFIEKTDSLNSYILDELKQVKNRAFICYHPSLTYFAKEYKLRQYPIELEGKSPSSAYLKQIIDLGRRENIDLILLQKQFDQHNAEIIAAEIGAKIILIDPLDLQWYEQMMFITDRIKAGTDE